MDRARETAGRLSEGRQEEISETMAPQAAVPEAVLKKFPHRFIRFGKRDERATHVARGKHAILVAQDAGRSAVVRHGDDGREFNGMVPQGVQNNIAAGSAADRNDPFLLAGGLFHG